jgi:hypothetical protein
VLPKTESLIQRISRWVNNHQQPDDLYRDLLSRATGRPRFQLVSEERLDRGHRGDAGRLAVSPVVDHRRVACAADHGEADMDHSLASHPRVLARTPQQVPFDYLECEDIWGMADRAYQALTGQELTVEVADLHPWPPELLEGDWDPGEDWDFDDAAEMRRRYPRLWALYGRDDTPSATP